MPEDEPSNLADNSGPRLFRFELWFQQFHNSEFGYFKSLPKYLDEERWEPPDPPPFFVGDLPKPVRKNILKEGFHGETFDRLAAAGVTQLYWRQSPRHLEIELVSDDVFQALVGIAPGSFRSKAQFTIDRKGVYHQLEILRFPRQDNDAGAVSDRPTLIREQCQPVVAADEMPHRIPNDGQVLAFPLWAARDDKVLELISGSLVTEGFVNAWRDTEISQYLQRTNQEFDIEFTPSRGQSSRFKTSYRWVDVDG